MNYGMAGPVPNFVVGATPRDVPMYAPTMIMAAEPDAPVEQRKEVSMAVQPPYQPQYQINMKPLYYLLALLALLVAATLVLTAVNTDSLSKLKTPETATVSPNFLSDSRAAPAGTNVCAGKQPASGYDNFACAEAAVNEQAAADVSSPFIGTKVTTAEPILTSYWQAGLCPVNVHWHIGAEHRSAGEFDEKGTGPAKAKARRASGGRAGFRCNKYDATDAKFTTEYAWKHCVDMHVGETYEVHWPHSAAGACGTINQYQTPFYDGVFCTDGVLTSTNKQIGVQSQTFTIVNDEAYYYPDLMRGMIVDGDFAKDVVFYTGSTTGDGRNNDDLCSAYAPITWQVDRKCHVVSASTFDKMCADMKTQRDDMSDDLYPHGSRELVIASLTANNMQAGSMSGGRASGVVAAAP